MITPLPGATPLVPGSCTLPLPGITAAIVDETGNDVPNGAGRHPGHQAALAVDDPHHLRTTRSASRRATSPRRWAAPSTWPATARCASADGGYFRITGRIDDVLNVSGHRLGTMEIESALVAKTDLVAEAAVVGRPDDMTGEAICAFVVLKRGRPSGDEAKQIANRAARLGGQGDRSDRQAQGHPLRRQPAQDAQRQDHAAPAALGRQGRERSPRTPPPWRTRPSWNSSARPTDDGTPARGAPVRQGPVPKCVTNGSIETNVEETLTWD